MSTFSIDPNRLEELLNHCIGFAKQMIEVSGEFYPFGAVITSSDGLTAVGGHTGDEHPDAGEVYLLLQNAMKAQFLNGEIVAAAIAANVTIPGKFKPPVPDGVRVHLECSGFSRFVYLPYQVKSNGVSYTEFISVDVPPVICA